MAGSARVTTISGGVFVVTFVASLILLGDEVGAFADSDGAFVEHFSTGSQRGADIAGAFLLGVAAAAFMYFTHLLAASCPPSNRLVTPVLVRTAGMLAGIFMVVAALALVTVPMSISMGHFFDEESKAFVEGQAVLPQFGYVTLVFGAMIPAAVTIAAVARLGLFRRWLNWLSISLAVLLALTSAMVASMVLLPIWVGVATVASRRTASSAADS